MYIPVRAVQIWAFDHMSFAYCWLYLLASDVWICCAILNAHCVSAVTIGRLWQVRSSSSLPVKLSICFSKKPWLKELWIWSMRVDCLPLSTNGLIQQQAQIHRSITWLSIDDYMYTTYIILYIVYIQSCHMLYIWSWMFDYHWISGTAIIFEFKHFKPKKKKVSTKAWALMELEEFRNNNQAKLSLEMWVYTNSTK